MSASWGAIKVASASPRTVGVVIVDQVQRAQVRFSDNERRLTTDSARRKAPGASKNGRMRRELREKR